MKTDLHSQAEPNLSDIPRIFLKYRGMIITTTVLTTLLFTAVSFMLPKKYKTSFVISIYPSYFQNPLAHDLTPQVPDSGEMRSLRESIIRQPFTIQFLDSLGDRYGLYQGYESTWKTRYLAPLLRHLGLADQAKHLQQDKTLQTVKREDLFKRISVLNLNNATFQVSFVYSNPDVVYQVTQEIYGRVIKELEDMRKTDLVSARDAIQNRLNALSEDVSLEEPSTPATAGAAGTAGGSASNTLDLSNEQPVAQELQEVRDQIRILSTRYTEDHPVMQELRQREKGLSELASASPEATVNHGGFSTSSAPRDALHDLYGDLTKKLNYLNIALASDTASESSYFATLESPLYPGSPLFPKKGLFVLYGLMVGLFGSFAIALIREYLDRSIIQASAIAQELGVALLGKLPMGPWEQMSSGTTALLPKP